jgi:hypothetical protein
MEPNKPPSSSGYIRATGKGNTPANATFMYLTNAGSADVKIGNSNGILVPGQKITLEKGKEDNYLESVPYDATGTVLLISYCYPYMEVADTHHPPTINITSPANNASFTTEPVTLSATATIDPDGSIAGVYFKVNGEIVGEVQKKAPYAVTWFPRDPGRFVITAVATDNRRKSTESSDVIVTVNLPG